MVKIEKSEIISKIYDFKNLEFNAEDTNYNKEILNYESMDIREQFLETQIKVNYSLHNFYLEIRLENAKIKIEKCAKAEFKKNKKGEFQLNITKAEAKNLADLIFTAYNVLENEREKARKLN